MDKIKEYYKERIRHYTLQKVKLDQQSKHFSILRLLCFIALGVSIYQCFVSTYTSVMIIISALFFIFFLWLIKRHDKIQRQRDWVERMLLINKNELDVLSDKPSVFNNGEEFFSTDSYFYDLDIFGEKSVYHLLNRTGTTIGANKLADCLKKPTLDKDEILEQQDAVKELSDKKDLRQNILATAINQKGKKSDVKNIQDWIDDKKTLVKSWWKPAVIIAPVLFTASVIYGLMYDSYYFFSIVFIVNLVACFYISRGIDKVHNKLSGASKLLKQYADIFSIISREEFNNKQLAGIHQVSHNATALLKKLSSIINLFDQRMNLLVVVFFNAIFFYDLHCIMMLERWKKNNGKNVSNWLECIAQIETLNSFATFAFNNPQCTIPKINENGKIVEAKNLAHPLMPASKRVSNDVNFGTDAKVILITGSNMSGKSTYLRTVGVNILLASCGAPVCADEFTFCPVNIYTSLRQSDSLQEDTSFFYAELKKLSEIVKHLEAGDKAIVLLDEVLKGTNSDDKTYGSQELIRKLKHFNALSLIATHDISLGRMEKESEGSIENFCFESSIENNELLFDYKLHKGVAVNKNATFLMKKMGIIE